MDRNQSEIRSYFYNQELETERRSLEENVHELQMKQVISRKQIEDHIGLLRQREWEIVAIEQKMSAQNAKLSNLENRLNELKKINSSLTEQLDIIFGSRSWKITKPLRVMTRFIRGN